MPTVRLDRALGRKVLAKNGRSIGRLEECCAETIGNEWVVTEYVIGSAGLLDRLHLGVRLLFGGKRQHGFVARWDQLSLAEPERPVLLCPITELRRL